MKSILPGIRKFQREVFPARRERFQELASGQQPSTLFITCSDSRIVPHLLTQTEPGELFVLRNAGNFVPPYTREPSGEAATIEYAVQVLGVRDIVICGHSHCGAVTGVLRPELVQNLPAVKQWLEQAQEVRQELEGTRLAVDASDDAVTRAVKANVLVQLEHLRTHPAVAEAESRGSLALHGSFYRFETGDVSVFEPESGRFVAVGHGEPATA